MLFFFHVIFLSVPNAIYTVKQGGGVGGLFLFGWLVWVGFFTGLCRIIVCDF